MNEQEAKKCFICDSFLVPKEKGRIKLESERVISYERGPILFTKAWIKKYGYFKRVAGKIGNKYICKDCLGDLKLLMEGGNNVG